MSVPQLGSRRSTALGLALALLVAAPLASAQEPAVDPMGPAGAGAPDWGYSIAHELMSPFCPGRTLAACPSPQADQLRQWILLQAAAGASQEEVEQMLFDRFGAEVMRSSPKAEGGWGISAYAIPVGGFLVGGAFVAWMIRRLARGSEAAPPPAAAGQAAHSSPPRTLQRPAAELPSDAELERMVDEELARS